MFEDRPERFAAWKLFLLGSFVIVLVAASVATITAFANRQDVVATLEEQASTTASAATSRRRPAARRRSC